MIYIALMLLALSAFTYFASKNWIEDGNRP